LLQNTATSEEEALSYFFQGEKMKSLSQTAKSSSRSHSILTIYIESRSKAETAEKTLVSKLNLVDLAGCERVSKIECSEESLKETMCKNDTNCKL
jgi:kinesin family protein 6/9